MVIADRDTAGLLGCAWACRCSFSTAEVDHPESEKATAVQRKKSPRSVSDARMRLAAGAGENCGRDKCSCTRHAVCGRRWSQQGPDKLWYPSGFWESYEQQKE